MDLERLVDRLRGDYHLATARVRQEKEGLKLLREQEAAATDAQVLVQRVAQAVQQRAHDQIAKVVSRCLSAVFDHPYEFRILFERKRGRTEARLVFVRKKGKREVEIDPADGCGGGVVDVAAFALRLACLLLQKPKRRRVLILDEPFKFVSERRDYRHRVRNLLETLADEMDIQFIMVTHDPVLQVGKVVEVK